MSCPKEMQAPSTSLSETNPLSNLGFAEILALADAAWAHSSASLPGNDGLDNPSILTFESQFMVDPVTNPTHKLLSPHHLSLEPRSIIHDNSQDPQGTTSTATSYIACCSKSISQDTPLTPDNAIRAESRQIASMQINIEERDPWGEEKNVPAEKLDNNRNPPNKELCDPVIEFAAVSTPLKENHNPDKGSSHDIDLTKTPQQKPRRRKHCPNVIIEGKPKRTQKPATPKPVQSKGNPTVKRKYVRRKGLNKTSTPPTEVTGELTREMMPESAKTSCRRALNFDIGARDESSTGRENATAHLSKEIGVVVQETNVGLAHDLNTSMKQASNNYIVISEDTQAPSTSPSRRKPPGAKPKENPTAKRKYVRSKGLNKTSAPTTEVTGELSKEMKPESAKISCRRSLNFGIGARDESSAGRENATVHLGKEIGVVAQETNVGLAYDLNTSAKQASNNYMSLPEDTQAPSTSPSKSNPPAAKPKEKPTGKRKYVRRKALNKSSTPPTEMTAELTEPTMPESTKMLRRRSFNFDIGARDESSAGRENLNVHISKENSVMVEEMHVDLAYDQSSSMEQALNNYMSLPEDTQAPSTSPSKSNPPGAKLNANSVENKNKINGQVTAQDGHENSAKLLLKSLAQSNPNDSNISNSQISTIRLQMVGSKRRHSGTIKRADTSSMNEIVNEIGAHYNEFPSYQTKFRVQFPNIQKKRRSEKGEPSNTSITSSVTTIKEVELTCPQDVARAHPYASSSSCWIFGSEYNTAGVPAIGEATESVIDDTQTFDDFILSLRRLTKRSRSPTEICDCASLTRIRSFDTEPIYSAKQLGISDRQTFGDAERPRTCIDALVAETSASLTKKKRNKKKSALSSSAYSSTNEMQQHHNFALGNYHLPLGKPLDIARELIWKTMQNVDALVEQFSQLVINTEARDLALHEQNALVAYIQQNQKQSSLVHGDGTIIPFQGSFDPIRKQHPPPKVDLHEETNRVWKLLMLDINSHGIDGMNEDQAKWWEEKRNVFRGRADSFIARMHLVQDWRFSQWIGSVVDSVLGVFLTHNVSNHLSSSPFMSLAARFLKMSSSKCKTYHGERTSLVVNKPQVHIVEPEENTKWDEKVLSHSVYDSNSEVEDLSSTEKYDIFYNSSSLRKLLKMASSTKLHEVNRQRSKLNENLSDAYGQSLGIKHDNRTENLEKSNAIQGSLEAPAIPSHEYTLKLTPYSGVLEVHCYDPFETEASSSGFLKNNDENDMNIPSRQTTEPGGQVAITHSQSMLSQLHPQEQSNHMLRNLFNISGQSQDLMQKARVLDFGDPGPSPFPSSTQCRIVEDTAIEEDPGPPSSPIQRQASSPVQHHGAGGISIEEDPCPPFSPIQDQAAEGNEASKRGFTPSPPRRTHDVITAVAMLLPEDSSGGSAAYASVPLVNELGQLVPGYLSTDHASLLNPFFERHPQMRLADKLSSRVKGFAYTCLANLLLFLRSHSTFQALTSRHAEFMDLLQDVRSFPFDTKWLRFMEESLFPHTCPAEGLEDPKVVRQNTTRELDAVCAEIDQSTRHLAQLHERRAYLMKLLEDLSLQEGIVQSALDILLDF